tara:strand:+ start:761 stop:1048 length:288 start_codon:yes stop_codon:yes gene_type:complete
MSTPPLIGVKLAGERREGNQIEIDIFSGDDDSCGQAELRRHFTARVCEGLGMPSEHAAMAAEVLVGANVRGIDSHGVPPTGAYAWWVDDGIESAT